MGLLRNGSFLKGWVNSVHGERFSERFSEGSDVFATKNLKRRNPFHEKFPPPPPSGVYEYMTFPWIRC